jgi:biopolymer transport protein ExbD
MLRPFNFRERMRPPAKGFDPVGLVDVCLIILFFLLLGSRFVMAPGITLRLPQTRGEGLAAATSFRVLTIGEAQGSEVLLFEGRLLTLDGFERVLAGEGGSGSLLVRLDRGVSVETLVRVADIARQAGFDQVQIAAEPQDRAAPWDFASP